VHAYREVQALSAQEAAYLAGLIDGEGTVTLSRKHAGDMRQLVVSISNTELPILELVLRTVGAGKLTHKCTSKANHSPSCAYAVWNRQALALLAQVEPYMRSYGKYTEAMLVERSVFEDALLALQAGRKRKPLQPCG
jgi:hypothetical protein